MIIIRNWQDCPEQIKGAVLAIGNFDGVHLGHQAVLGKGYKTAQQHGIPLAVMTFWPHPRRFFNKSLPENSLASLHRQVAIMGKSGVTAMFIARFNASFAGLPPHQFTEHVLHKSLAVKHVITGHDFSYGHKRAGNSESLKQDCSNLGIGYTALEQIDIDGLRCSSSAIRKHIANGEVEAAASMLGRDYSIEGRVMHGDKRGRQIGFPTANISAHGYCVPKYGVYAVSVKLADGTIRNAVANIGLRPTFGGDLSPRLEVHIPDFDGDIYGHKLEISFRKMLRPEQKFNHVDELKAQIKLDAENALAYFAKDIKEPLCH